MQMSVLCESNKAEKEQWNRRECRYPSCNMVGWREGISLFHHQSVQLFKLIESFTKVEISPMSSSSSSSPPSNWYTFLPKTALHPNHGNQTKMPSQCPSLADLLDLKSSQLHSDLAAATHQTIVLQTQCDEYIEHFLNRNLHLNGSEWDAKARPLKVYAFESGRRTHRLERLILIAESQTSSSAVDPPPSSSSALSSSSSSSSTPSASSSFAHSSSSPQQCILFGMTVEEYGDQAGRNEKNISYIQLLETTGLEFPKRRSPSLPQAALTAYLSFWNTINVNRSQSTGKYRSNGVQVHLWVDPPRDEDGYRWLLFRDAHLNRPQGSRFMDRLMLYHWYTKVVFSQASISFEKFTPLFPEVTSWLPKFGPGDKDYGEKTSDVIAASARADQDVKEQVSDNGESTPTSLISSGPDGRSVKALIENINQIQEEIKEIIQNQAIVLKNLENTMGRLCLRNDSLNSPIRVRAVCMSTNSRETVRTLVDRIKEDHSFEAGAAINSSRLIIELLQSLTVNQATKCGMPHPHLNRNRNLAWNQNDHAWREEDPQDAAVRVRSAKMAAPDSFIATVLKRTQKRTRD